MYIEATMKDLSSTGILRYFPPANDNATRQSDVASLARAITDRRTRPRYLDKAEESRGLLREEGGGDLDVRCARIPERSYQESWAISTAANAWRILEEVRETWIDDPGARFEKQGAGGEVRG